MDDLRECSKRKLLSSKSKFYKDIFKIDGYRPECKFCTNQYHYKNREKRNLGDRKRIVIDVNYRLIRNTRQKLHHALNGKSKSS